jgi:hypothetical protein
LALAGVVARTAAVITSETKPAVPIFLTMSVFLSLHAAGIPPAGMFKLD